jgi:uncharacterized membrane protein
MEGEPMSHHESTAKGPDGRMVDRMLFFSDAVFAIVLTIMVLELRPPVLGTGLDGVSSEAIWHALAGVGRVLFSYLVSFVLVSLWWTIHMRVTRSMHQFDWPAASANLFFLLTVTLVPFASSVLAEGPNSAPGWEIYWSINALASLSMTILMFVVSRKGGYLIGGMGGRERAARLIQSIGPGIGFSVGAWLAANGQLRLSQNCWLVIIPCMILARLIYKATKHVSPQPPDEPRAPAEPS